MVLLVVVLASLISLARSFSTFSSSSDSIDASSSPPPPPPWEFQASRIHYHFLRVPTDVARRCIPFRQNEGANNNKQDDDGGSYDNLTLLSIGGQTLGGLFAIEYSASPIGPYKEIAVLAGLVTEKRRVPVPIPGLGQRAVGLPNLWRVGAWASHIFVDSEDAAAYGRKFWGLPASVVPIDLDMALHNGIDGQGIGVDNNGVEANSLSCPSFVLSDEEGVGVSGWTGIVPLSTREQNKYAEPASLLGRFVDVTLPSYSGRLSATDPLLRYPLTISNLGQISMGAATMPLTGQGGTIGDEKLRQLLDKATPLISVDIRGAQLIAATPEEL